MKLLVFSVTNQLDTAIAFVDENISDTNRRKLVEDMTELIGPAHISDEIEITSTRGDRPLDEIIQMNMLYIDTTPTEFDE